MKCQHCLKIFGAIATIKKDRNSDFYLRLCFSCSEIYIKVFFYGKSYNFSIEKMEDEN